MMFLLGIAAIQVEIIIGLVLFFGIVGGMVYIARWFYDHKDIFKGAFTEVNKCAKCHQRDVLEEGQICSKCQKETA